MSDPLFHTKYEYERGSCDVNSPTQKKYFLFLQSSQSSLLFVFWGSLINLIAGATPNADWQRTVLHFISFYGYSCVLQQCSYFATHPWNYPTHLSNGYRLFRRIDLLAIEGVKDRNKNENERENEFKSVKKKNCRIELAGLRGKETEI